MRKEDEKSRGHLSKEKEQGRDGKILRKQSNMELQAREGDLLETSEGLIFDVKGFIHPQDRIIAFIRYYPDTSGDRIREGIRYKKIYALDKRYAFLKEKYPHYLFRDAVSGELLQGVPKENIRKIYRPADFLRDLLKKDEVEDLKLKSQTLHKALELIKLIHKQSNIDLNKMGITGSCLVNLETEQSDIDLIVFGSKNAYLVRQALITLHNEFPEIIKPYSEKTIGDLFTFRGQESNITFQEFVKIEQRKKLQGIFKGVDYYIRCIKEWNEISNEFVQYKPIKISTIRAIIIDDSEAIFTPCRYLIDNVKIISGEILGEPIREIVSYRGRFCEQAWNGEKVEVCGKIEQVISRSETYFRLLLGANEGDYFRVLSI